MDQKQSDAKISQKQVRHVADLARLDMDDDSIEIFAEQIGNILEHIDALNRVETDGVAPMSNALELNNAFRQDEVGNHLEVEKALSNAPEKEEREFIVPKIIG